ncbi:hypothetical protein OQJ44_13165, partial [Enterococcus faecium]|uniref:hypothetical protein n=1 Tax=Enterococcus faecium TaxID=1352 RepID=UPI0022433932
MSALGLVSTSPRSVNAWEIVLNALPHAVMLVDRNGLVGAANDAAQAFFQASLSVLRRHQLKDLVP